MLKPTAFAIAFLISSPLSAQSAPPSIPAPSLIGRCAVVPMAAGSAIPVVEVMIDGKGPYRFAIDTGAQGHGRIGGAAAKALGLAEVGKVGTPGPNGTVNERPIYGIKSLALGDLVFGDVELIAMSDVRGPGVAWDGILGIDLFRELTLTLDYGNATMMASKTPLAGGTTARFDRSIPVVEVEIAGKRFPVHLDTGNLASALFLPEAAARALPLAGEPVERGRARTSFGDFAVMEAPLAAPVTLDGHTLTVSRIGWPSVRPPGNLGSFALAGSIVAIDRRAGRVSAAKSGAAPACD